jgi:hypothetical protein
MAGRDKLGHDDECGVIRGSSESECALDCWPPAMPGHVLDLLASKADVSKKPIVHCVQFGNAVAHGELVDQPLEQRRYNSKPTSGQTAMYGKHAI